MYPLWYAVYPMPSPIRDSRWWLWWLCCPPDMDGATDESLWTIGRSGRQSSSVPDILFQFCSTLVTQENFGQFSPKKSSFFVYVLNCSDAAMRIYVFIIFLIAHTQTTTIIVFFYRELILIYSYFHHNYSINKFLFPFYIIWLGITLTYWS